MSSPLTSTQPFFPPDEMQVLLTLVGHADRDGLVTTLSLTDIQDFANLSSTDMVQRVISNLVIRHAVSVLRVSPKKTHYHLSANWRKYQEQANAYVEGQRQRVIDIRNRRAVARVRTVNAIDLPRSLGKIEIVNLERLDFDTNSRYKWRFGVKIDGLGAVYDCLYTAKDLTKPGFVYGPRRPAKNGAKGSHWVPTIEFEPEINTKLAQLLFQLTRAEA